MGPSRVLTPLDCSLTRIFTFLWTVWINDITPKFIFSTVLTKHEWRFFPVELIQAELFCHFVHLQAVSEDVVTRLPEHDGSLFCCGDLSLPFSFSTLLLLPVSLERTKAKRLSASGGASPADLLIRGSAPGPCWGLRSQTPAIGSRSRARHVRTINKSVGKKANLPFLLDLQKLKGFQL